jgi:hypothetical protein
MNDNEKTLRALSLISTELYIQNEISIAKLEGYVPGYSYVDEEKKKKLADHFLSFFEGGGFFPGAVAKFTLGRGKHS